MQETIKVSYLFIDIDCICMKTGALEPLNDHYIHCVMNNEHVTTRPGVRMLAIYKSQEEGLNNRLAGELAKLLNLRSQMTKTTSLFIPQCFKVNPIDPILQSLPIEALTSRYTFVYLFRLSNRVTGMSVTFTAPMKKTETDEEVLSIGCKGQTPLFLHFRRTCTASLSPSKTC